jgi:quinol monooxygenase YgiN
MSTSSPLTIIAIATAVRGKESALRAAQEALVADTLVEPGCLRYELNQSLDDRRVLIFVESWANEEVWRAHMQGAAMRRFQASGGPEMIDEFSLYRMAPVAGADSPA